MSFTAVALHSCLNAFVLVSSVSSMVPDATDRKIMAFARNQRYAAVQQSVVIDALHVTNKLRAYGFVDMEAFSGNEGEILVSAFKDDVCFEVTVEFGSKFTVAIEKDDQRIGFEENLAMSGVETKLREVLRQTWISSVGFGQTTGLTARTVGSALLSKIGQAPAAASP